MATHSSILAWRIPWTEEPGGLQSMGSQTVEHNCVTDTHTEYSLKSGSRILPALFFFLKIALAIQSLLCFHTN